MSVTARHWLLDPETHLDQNVQVGLGIKLPTGSPDETYQRLVQNDDGSTSYETRTADQSVQPGDGGFGFTVDFSAFKNIGEFTPYVAGTYLFNPRNTNSIPTFRSRASEAVMSVADQYLARAGTLWTPADSTWSYGLGARIEGVPVHDFIGGEDGFRRPGYSVGIEPSVIHSWGHSSISLSVPIAVLRNRQRSTSDLKDGKHGDAAFADWALLFGWTYRF